MSETPPAYDPGPPADPWDATPQGRRWARWTRRLRPVFILRPNQWNGIVQLEIHNGEVRDVRHFTRGEGP